MRYSTPQLFAYAIISIVLTAGALLSVRYLLEPALESLALPGIGGAVHAFLFERSPVQWCTLSMFFFSLTVVAARLIHHSAIRRSLQVIAPLDVLAQEIPARVVRLVGERIKSIRTCLATHGRNAAVWEAEDLARRDEDNMEQVYALLGSAVQVMLSLGFFGTVWGISRSMFGSFSELSGGAPEQIRTGLRQFTEALSTALDTTVLALVCAILASIAVTVMRWAEAGGLTELAELMRKKFDLVAQSETAAARQAAREISAAGAESAGHLREFAAQTMQTLNEKISDLTQQGLSDLRDRYGSSRSEAAEGINAARREFEEAMNQAQQAFEARLAQAVATLEEHGRFLRGKVLEGLAKVERGLHRVPQISIRYPRTAQDQRAQVQQAEPPAERDSPDEQREPDSDADPPVGPLDSRRVATEPLIPDESVLRLETAEDDDETA